MFTRCTYSHATDVAIKKCKICNKRAGQIEMPPSYKPYCETKRTSETLHQALPFKIYGHNHNPFRSNNSSHGRSGIAQKRNWMVVYINPDRHSLSPVFWLLPRLLFVEGNRSDVLHPLLLQPLAHEVMIVGPDAPTILYLEDLVSISAHRKVHAHRQRNNTSTARQSRARWLLLLNTKVSSVASFRFEIYVSPPFAPQILEHQLKHMFICSTIRRKYRR